MIFRIHFNCLHIRIAIKFGNFMVDDRSPILRNILLKKNFDILDFF